MADVIQELKDEHQFLQEKLQEIKDKGMVSEEGKKELFEIKDALLSHLKKEDEQLYPVLREYAQKDAQFKETLDWYINQMAEISQKAMDFFKKYENGAQDNVQFSKDLGELMAVIKSRISKEEMILFKKFQEIQGS